jgi:lysophospholipase L1-like esterase
LKIAPLACLALVLSAQPPPEQSALLSGRPLFDAYQRVIQLMESSTIVIPDLARAGAPLLDSERRTLASLRTNATNADLHYTFLNNLRAYLALTDAVAKPFPFPAEAQRQLHELRDAFARIDSHFHALIEQKDRQLRSPDPSNLTRFADDDSRLGPPKPEKPRVVFLGDSITDFWRLNEYFPDRDFINRGISGQITGQMLGRMQSDVIALQPRVVVVLGGTNDLARGMSLNAIEDNLTIIADLADYHKIKVIFASVLPVSDYHKDVNPSYEMTPIRPPVLIRALNDWIKSLCTRRNYTYLDYYSEMVDAAGFLKTDLADDGLHPNSAGYRIMAPLAQTAIESVVRVRTTVAAATPVAPVKQKKHRLLGR